MQRTDIAESHEILKEKLKEVTDGMDQVSARAHTDEDINELIARTPEEVELFNRIDEEEKKKIEKSIRKGASPPLPRLMTEREVPAWLQVLCVFLFLSLVHACSTTNVSGRRTSRQNQNVVGMLPRMPVAS